VNQVKNPERLSDGRKKIDVVRDNSKQFMTGASMNLQRTTSDRTHIYDRRRNRVEHMKRVSSTAESSCGDSSTSSESVSSSDMAIEPVDPVKLVTVRQDVLKRAESTHIYDRRRARIECLKRGKSSDDQKPKTLFYDAANWKEV